MKVYVVAWEFEHGGGFWWYPKPEDADKAFEDEKRNCDVDGSSDKWTAYLIDMEVAEGTNDEITNEVDQKLHAVEFDSFVELGAKKYPADTPITERNGSK